MDVNCLESVHDNADVHLIPILHQVKPHLVEYLFMNFLHGFLSSLFRDTTNGMRCFMEAELLAVQIGCQKILSWI
ncbi:hypothetical protein Y032_0028g1758 [Ancylostoma ceylanicum]|uniref:Uncharacterized protein n=1 Tax=Ancylostoma ceylanicum TaxID=53326 RepID=A0A016UUU9_9BILA|nr:hypothetical protein Y032_0028g1758 [Ancylostoma ceylanicum]